MSFARILIQGVGNWWSHVSNLLEVTVAEQERNTHLYGKLRNLPWEFSFFYYNSKEFCYRKRSVASHDVYPWVCMIDLSCSLYSFRKHTSFS